MILSRRAEALHRSDDTADSLKPVNLERSP